MLNIAILYRESSIVLLMIMYIISALILFIIENFNHIDNKYPIYFSKETESTLDIISVAFPTFIVGYLIIPAIGFIYNTEYTVSQIETLFDVSIIGHQWYWSYEYSINICNESILRILGNNFIHEKLTFDSLIDMNNVDARLLAVDKKLILPSNIFINLMITSEDVIHSWALPQLGIKVDAIPGRVAEYIFFANFNGIYYGQCSELCGVNHGFMPISVETVPYLEFLDFLLISLNFNPSTLLLELLDLNILDPLALIDEGINKGRNKNEIINKGEIINKDEDENKNEIINKDEDENKNEIINKDENKNTDKIINEKDEINEEINKNEDKDEEINRDEIININKNKDENKDEIVNKDKDENKNEDINENINEDMNENINKNEDENKNIENIENIENIKDIEEDIK